jgi:hypothetical protein
VYLIRSVETGTVSKMIPYIYIYIYIYIYYRLRLPLVHALFTLITFPTREVDKFFSHKKHPPAKCNKASIRRRTHFRLIYNQCFLFKYNPQTNFTLFILLSLRRERPMVSSYPFEYGCRRILIKFGMNVEPSRAPHRRNVYLPTIDITLTAAE